MESELMLQQIKCLEILQNSYLRKNTQNNISNLASLS